VDGGSAIRVRHEVWVGWLPSQQKEWGNCERAKAQRMVWGIWQSHALGGMVCPPTCWCLGFWSGQWGNASQAIGIENHLMFSWWYIFMCVLSIEPGMQIWFAAPMVCQQRQLYSWSTRSFRCDTTPQGIRGTRANGRKNDISSTPMNFVWNAGIICQI
jgi:hypothetical protein